MTKLWSTLYEHLTLARQRFRTWYARAFGTDLVEGVYPDAFWNEAPVRPRGAAPSLADRRRFRLVKDGNGNHSILMVKHSAPSARLYFDHATQRQLDFMGRGRRDKTGKRVPIYGNMVLRTNPQSLIDHILADEQLWDELRRIVMPQLSESDKRAVEWRRYWIHAHLTHPLIHWQNHPTELQALIRVLGNLAAKVENVEVPVVPPSDDERE